MKSKALIAVAVASTFGWSAGAVAGFSPEVQTPMSVSESAPWLAYEQQRSAGMTREPSSSFATSSAEETIFGSPLADSSDWTGSVEQVALADELNNTGYDVIAFVPVVVESWDYYIIEPASSDELAMIDFSGDELALIDLSADEVAMGESDYIPSGSLQENVVAQVLTDNPVEDTANVG